MTLQEIYDKLVANIQENGGTLKLSPGLISSPEITRLFDDYLLNKNLEIKNAQPALLAAEVTVKGEGNSLIFFKTTVDALRFTVDVNGVPSMSVTADAIIKPKEGWTLAASFPVLELGNWSGFPDPSDQTKWIQHVFFENASFTLSADGLFFRGFLKFEKGLEPLSVLFKGQDKAEMKGAITLNKGSDGYVVDVHTVVPLMTLNAEIGKVEIPLGDFQFTLTFGMRSSRYIIDRGPEKGRPGVDAQMFIQSTIPVNNEELGIAIGVSVVNTSGLTMQAVIPENTEIGMSELIALANNSNVLAVMPSNIPVINQFVLQSWQLNFDVKQLVITKVGIAVETRKDFQWDLIPGLIKLRSLGFWLNVAYRNKKIEPDLTIEGSITIGRELDSPTFQVSAAFPAYVFMGSLDPETPIDLRPILIYFLGEELGKSLPDTLKIGVLVITIDPKNATYLLNTVLTTDLELPMVLTTITVKQVSVNVNYVAGQATGSVSGDFKVGEEDDSPQFTVTAAYEGPDDGWVFSGELQEGSTIKIKKIIDRFLPAEYHQFNPFNIEITKLFVSFTQGKVKKYRFMLAAEWKLDLGLSEPIPLGASVDIAYDSSQPAGKQYTGYIEGHLDKFGNITMGVRVDFKGAYNDYTFYFKSFQAKLTRNAENDSIICFNFTEDTTLGDMIALLVSAATGQDITLPSPWNVMDNINLKNFSFSFNITRKKIGLSYRPSINLGFIDIKEITLYYTYGGAKPVVEFAITEGSFLGGAQPLPKPWNVLDPSAAPAVPGKGTKLFRLDFLGMGQHVSLKSGLSPKSVTEAVGLLKAGFEKKNAGLLPAPGASPIGDTGLKFNSNSNWLIGTEFVILETFNLGIVFYDPDLYGLALYVDGAKAKVFQGLKFEILYKKVTDTVGVYQIYLKLPDSIRQIDFGSVSITLPSIRLYIYTNGDFKVDLGFPLNDNFSESFGLQMLPFMGAGGFYIGVLSGATAENVPATTKGNFSPVIVFGIGLRVGVGKEINKGILKAGVSVTVQGILEGTFAQFNPFKGSGEEDEIYYYILGKLSIVGHLYGAVNFAIISAEVDIKVYISVRIVLESYEPILLAMSAGVSVSLKVKVNLGIFSFSVNVSFSTTVELSFTIGQRSIKPWDGSLSIPYRLPALQALDAGEPCIIPLMNWQPVLPDEKLPVEMWYVPQFTVATDKDSLVQTPRVSAMLYLESSIDQPGFKRQVWRRNKLEDEDYPFTKLAKGVFLWLLGAYFNKKAEPVKVDAIENTFITPKELSEILCYFSVKDQVHPFKASDILKFMEHYMDVTIVVPPRNNGNKSASIFPILPILSLKTPDGTIYFDDQKATYTYDATQLKLIRDLFRELSVQTQNNNSPNEADMPLADDKESLATYMLVDYIAMLAKEAVQRGIDRMEEMIVVVPAGESLNGFVNKHPEFGIGAQELAFSNRTRPLNAGVPLTVKGVRYSVKRGDTLDSIAYRFNVSPDELLHLNSHTIQAKANPCSPTEPWIKVSGTHILDANGRLIEGNEISLPPIQHMTSANRSETLLSVANLYGINIHSFLGDNLDVPDLFLAGASIRVPFVEKILVKDLITAMEEHYDFENMSGLSSNIMLQGLRVPLPEADSKIGKPEALYVVTGQAIDAASLKVGDELTLQLENSLPWLNLGTTGGTSLAFTIESEDINGMQSLAGVTLTPLILELRALGLFDIQPRKFTLPSYIDWQAPQAIRLVNGPNDLQDTIDPTIWAFKNNLQSLISGGRALQPKVELLRQVQETINRAKKPEPVKNYSWSTTMNVQLRQVRKAENPAELMPNVYEVQGIDQASMMLLRNLVEYYGIHEHTDIINVIEILYTKEPAKEGQQKPPTGLRSDGIANTTVFLLQTNLSTLSNPAPMLNRLNTGMPGVQPNLLGMTPIEFLRFLWEAAIVGTGGYYLYYLVNDSKAGLPGYLFNEDHDATITLVITYNITDNVLQNFLNSVVIRDKIDVTSEILYVQAVDQTVKVATVPPGNMGFYMKRKNPEKRTDNVTRLEKDLEELYNLLEFNIADNTDFNQTASSLPVAPANRQFEAPTDPDIRLRPTAVTEEDWEYERIVRVFPFIKTPPGDRSRTTWKMLAGNTKLEDGDIPAEKENPYRATGKSVQLDMRWLDVFGNLTLFHNMGVSGQLPPVTIGYIDAVIGLDQYPSITASYIIQKDDDEQPVLEITLAFNPTKYQPTEKDPDGWKERARVDRDMYKLIYYQLLQDDMKITLSNSLQPDALNFLVDPKTTLMAYVVEVYEYLSLLTPTAVPPSDKTIKASISDNNPLSLFALVTRLTLARDPDLVDPNFRDEPSVISATSTLGPNLKKDAAAAPGEDNSITIQEFAKRLQDAFPELKAASGLSQEAVQKDSSVDIWVVRFNKLNTGIHFSILNKGNPFYFALQPLSTYLLSREDVLIYPYTSGTPIYDNQPMPLAFNGIDLEKMAENFLNAMDVFLQADYSVPAWKVENAAPEKTSKGSIDIPHPYQAVINAKKDLAKNISRHLSTVLQDGNQPDNNNLQAAMDRLEQQLLITLSDAYNIDTVLQFNVDVVSPYTDPDVIAPNLFGKVLDPSDTSTPDQKAYAFSTSRFSLEKSSSAVPGNEKRSYLTILFNTKKENLKAEDKSYFPIDLQFEVNSIEHDIHPVPGIADYKSSSWLNFILPFDHENTGLGNLKIPIPLRAYPTAPSLTAQQYIAHCPQFNAMMPASIADIDKLPVAKAWDYRYTYDYVRAQQDTIYTDILLNGKTNKVNKLFRDDDDPDLFAALLQFTNVYPDIQRDLNQYLLNQSNPQYALTAMQSFAWLAGRIAKAWANWTEQKKLYRDTAAGENSFRYQVAEDATVIDGKDALRITVSFLDGASDRLPDVEMEGYTMEQIGETAKTKQFAYYKMEENSRKYLSPSEGMGIPQRSIRLKDLNIIQEENAWSGLSIVRNKILVPGIATNDDFIYETPVIRFVNILTPLLDPDIAIDMGVYTDHEQGRQPLALYISNFFQAYFKEIKDINGIVRVIKTSVGYSYSLPGITDDALRIQLPISLTTPVEFTIPDDWKIDNCLNPKQVTNTDSFVCQLSALVLEWFARHRPMLNNGRLQFGVSLFSSLSDTQLPVLNIRNITLDINIVDLDKNIRP